RHPGTQRLREVELAAHGGGGDRLDLLAHAGVVGDQLDHLLGEEGRVDVGDQQSGHGVMTVPLPSTVMPVSVTTQPPARTFSSSRPIWVRGGTTTSLSMIARWIWQ